MCLHITMPTVPILSQSPTVMTQVTVLGKFNETQFVNSSIDLIIFVLESSYYMYFRRITYFWLKMFNFLRNSNNFYNPA